MRTTKRAVLLSCSDHYNHRLYVIDGYLKSQGYETVYYTGDFDHSSKKVFHCSVPGCRQIHVRPYRKNLSLARILSHRDFARLVFQELEQDPPDVVVAQLPPNYLAHYGARFKRRHPDTKLIFEIFDMWPETFPSGSVKQLLALPFSIWAGLRDKNLPAADRVIPSAGCSAASWACRRRTPFTWRLSVPRTSPTRPGFGPTVWTCATWAPSTTW